MTNPTEDTAPAERSDALAGRAGARGSAGRAQTRARRGRERSDLYQNVTDQIIAELEQGRAPWVQPWGRADVSAPLGLPMNGATGRNYSGINILLLWGAAIEGARSGQTWLTFKQALSLGGCVRKGERGTTVVYADRFTPKAEKERAARDGNDAQSIPFLKRYTVFNTDQCEGLPDTVSGSPAPLPQREIVPRAEDLIAARGRIFGLAGTAPITSQVRTSFRFRRSPHSLTRSIITVPAFTNLATGRDTPSGLPAT